MEEFVKFIVISSSNKPTMLWMVPESWTGWFLESKINKVAVRYKLKDISWSE